MSSSKKMATYPLFTNTYFNQLWETIKHLSDEEIRDLCISNREINRFCRENPLVQQLFRERREERGRIDQRIENEYRIYSNTGRKLEIASGKGDYEVVNRILEITQRDFERVLKLLETDRIDSKVNEILQKKTEEMTLSKEEQDLVKTVRINIKSYNLALVRAADNCHVVIVNRLLKDPRVDINYNKGLPLQVAVRNNCVEVAKRLLNDPNLKWENGALLEAVREKNRNMIELILKSGRINPNFNNGQPFLEAVRNDYFDIVDQLLDDASIDPGIQNNVAIASASYHGYLDIVNRLLVDPRVDPSNFDNRAIDFASSTNKIQVMRRLLQDPRVLNTLSKTRYEKYLRQIQTGQ